MTSTLIMSCAGKSSRFQDVKAKPYLTHPNGDLMLMEALKGLDKENVSRLIIMVVKCHIQDNNINLDKIANEIKIQQGILPEFYILEDFLPSRSEAMYKLLLDMNIAGPIFIKDCDNYFETKIIDNNAICFSHLQDKTNAINKAYITLNKYGIVSGIIEKTVVGDLFCVGGYSFRDADIFLKTYEKLLKLNKINQQEIYLSHIIQEMILNQERFLAQEISDYQDWGTLEDWQNYVKQFKTIFIDLDGVLVVNGSEYMMPYWGESAGLATNIEYINNLYDTGKVSIIITTSRKQKYREETIQQLKEVGMKFHYILFNLPHAQRILINDFSKTNPYPSAVGISPERNRDNLPDLLKSLIGE